MKYRLGFWFMLGVAISLYLIGNAVLVPHEGLRRTVFSIPYFTFCPGNVILAAGFGFGLITQVTVLAGAILNGAVYALLAFGLFHIPTHYGWIKPLCVLVAFGFSYAIQGEIAVLGITLQQPLTAAPPTLANLTDRNQHFCLPRYQCQFQRERTHHYLRLSTRFS